MYQRKKDSFRRVFSLLLCALTVLLLAVPAAASADETDGQPLTVGVPVNRCPLFYLDEDSGEIQGIGVELMRNVAEKAGYTATFRVIQEETLKQALDADTYDVIMPFGSAITSASGQQSIVTENLMQTPFAFVTRENSTLPPMDRLRVGMLRSLGGAIETLHQLFPGMEIMEYDTMAESVKALRRGEVDALLHNSYIWSYVLQKPSYQDLAVQPSKVFSMDFRVGTLDTPKGRSIVQRLNEGVAALDDIQRQAIILDYTSRRLYRYDISDYLYQYGLVLLLGVLLFVALIVIAVQQIRDLRREQEEKLRQMMDHDPLTGVLSMNGFRKRVEELLHEHPEAPYLLFYSNIRDFKFINDSLGRAAGDELLRFWAQRAMDTLSDKEAMGRIAADHFVTLRYSGGEEQICRDERNVVEPVNQFFLRQGKENRVQICSGVYVLTPEDFKNIDVDRMLDMALVAEKRALESRQSSFEFYNPEQWDRGKRIANIVNYLPAALDSGDIQVWYQPQVNYNTGRVIGAEALCRWDHSKLGWLQPAGFIATLEEAGLIYDLDRFVWERVCQDLHRWNEQGQRKTVSVNVSRDDIREERDIPEVFHHLIETYSLTADQLHIEITESAYAENPELLISTTQQLQALGFQVEMDDFGSGYSSLHMLKEVPVNRIKLDLHFLTSSGDPEKSRIIVSAMIQMVNELGLELIAEGVETTEQADFLQSKGGGEMQGYLFYKPMPVNEFEKVDGFFHIEPSAK